MKNKEVFSSRWHLIMATLGMAVGTGNIWRFPRMVAQNGGGSFLVPWMIFLFTWSIPLIIVEFAIGKRSGMGTVGSFSAIVGKGYAWMGAFVGFCTMAIMFYYSVVTGWCMRYILASGFGMLSSADPASNWDAFASSSWQPLLFHFIAIVSCSVIVFRGIVGGIEKVIRVIVPLLFLLLIVAAVRALTLPGASLGLTFLFKPSVEHLFSYRVWLEALSQSAWSTGAGWGLVLTYAIYSSKREDVALNSFLTGLGNNSASLLAAMAVLPTVFSILPYDNAMEAISSDNIGLTFKWIPYLFNKLPLGRFFMTTFFFALTLAAISSLISMLELSGRIFMDMGLDRRRAITIVTVAGFLLGIPSALSMGFFHNQDWVWGIGLLVSGLFFAVSVMSYGPGKFRKELINLPGNDMRVGRWFDVMIMYVIPIEFVLMIVWWFTQAVTVYDREGWWNPFHSTSLGTCLLQWVGMIIVFKLINDFLWDKTFRRIPIQDQVAAERGQV
ncbi:MAG: sodium-dependent transporter [Candidatus Glassbacteria bacterium]